MDCYSISNEIVIWGALKIPSDNQWVSGKFEEFINENFNIQIKIWTRFYAKIEFVVYIIYMYI